jgi:hypothetical protein
VTWNPRSGYITPASQTQTLTAGGSISFYGVYQAVPQVGSISVDSNLSGSGFTLSGPAGVSAITPYSNANAGVGTYTVTWNPRSGYVTPVSETKALIAGGSISFYGNYGVDSGLPPVPTSGWHNYKGGRISWRVTSYGIELDYPGTFTGYPRTSTQGQQYQLAAIIQDTWVKYESLFMEAARTYQVPPIVLLAIAATESSGNADILGGLMQTSTHNGQYVSARDSIMDAAQGWLGPSYTKYRGDPIFQAAAYNAGSVKLAKTYSKPDGSGKQWGLNDWNMKMVSSDATYFGSYAWKFAANFNSAVAVVGAVATK